MNDPAQKLLLQIIRDYGLDIASDPQRLNALLKDYAQGQFKREIFLCVQAVREGVVSELQHCPPSALDTLAARLSKQLTEDCGFDSDASDWTVTSWLAALGLLDQCSFSKPPTQSPPVTPTALPAPKRTKLRLVPLDPVDPPDTTFTSTLNSVSWFKKLIEPQQYYVDNGNGTVTDKRTGLQWMRPCLGQYWNGFRCDHEAKEYTLTDALAAVQLLNTNTDYNLGFYNWRIPSMDELSSIRGPSNEVIDPKAFPSTPNGRFWTTSERESVDENGQVSKRFYTVNFNRFNAHYSSGTALPSDIKYVRLVRGPVS